MKKYNWESKFELSALSRELVDMALKEDIGEAEIADWIMWCIGIAEAHADVQGP